MKKKELIIGTSLIILAILLCVVWSQAGAMWDEPGGASYPPPVEDYPTLAPYPAPGQVITATVVIGAGEPPTTRGPGCVGVCPTQDPGWPWTYPAPVEYPTAYPEP